MKTAFDYFLAVIFLLAMWEVLSLWLNESFFPGPLESFMTFIREMGDELGAHLLVSTARVIVSLLAALLPAVLLGMVLGRVESLTGMQLR